MNLPLKEYLQKFNKNNSKNNPDEVDPYMNLPLKVKEYLQKFNKNNSKNNPDEVDPYMSLPLKEHLQNFNKK